MEADERLKHNNSTHVHTQMVLWPQKQNTIQNGDDGKPSGNRLLFKTNKIQALVMYF